MNIEETKEAIKVMQAFVDGKQITSKHSPCDKSDNPYWSWGNDISIYRIKPTTTFRPWTADEVPLGAWIRYKGNNQSIRMLIVCSKEKGLCGYHTYLPYDYLRDEMEHSTDGGKTWHPCGVMEDVE